MTFRVCPAGHFGRLVVVVLQVSDRCSLFRQAKAAISKDLEARVAEVTALKKTLTDWQVRIFGQTDSAGAPKVQERLQISSHLLCHAQPLLSSS